MTDQISDAAASEAINPSFLRASHAPIGIGGIGLDRRKLCGPRMAGRKVTHRVGGAGIAGERQGLAATAAEIRLATRAACARLVIAAQRDGGEGRNP
jgi:hypothetical protein